MHPTTLVARRERRIVSSAAPVRWLLIGVALAFLGFFLVVPMVAVFSYALQKGVGAYLAAIQEPESLSA
ncbi:MAG TPA: sulfate/thiosulfate ABC transporter permease CysW, partial [Archangium sp.]